jgi:hypothetical protein
MNDAMMTTDAEQVGRGERWSLTAAKFSGWLTGLAFTVFGGLLCSVPVGSLIGVPVVAVGVFLCLTFSMSMSATLASPRVSYPLIVLGLALIVFGRMEAPIDQIVESFRTGQTLVRKTGLHVAFGIPLILLGVHLVQLATPWVRFPDHMHVVRGIVALALILAGSIALLSGAVMTLRNPDWHAQPLWAWIGVPVAFALGIGPRMRWRGWGWLVLIALIAATLPLTWLLMVRHA